MRIEDYALIGDMQSAALVGRDGSVDWLCLPRFDSPACFAALLGNQRHGSWRIWASGMEMASSRRYWGDTLVLESTWDTPGGTARVIDFMPIRHEHPRLVRVVEGVAGSVEMNCEIRIRFDYGRIVPWVRRRDGSLQAVAGPDSAWIHSPVHLHGSDYRHKGTFRVEAGDKLSFVFSWHPSHAPAPPMIDPLDELDYTREIWEDWVSKGTHAGEWRDAVVRSMITLKGLTYAPTGGIVAAATTSLPEDLGGVRNWDYRFCWLRDASMTLDALLTSGYIEEAKAWREWLLRAIAGRPQDLQIMYGVAGERRLPEMTLDWLPGYENSLPARIGNSAANQLQLDVYGEVVNSLYQAGKGGLHPDDHAWKLTRKMMDFLETGWQQPDEGLWEVRGPRRQFTHSKVMVWVACDRVIRTMEAQRRSGPIDRWKALREEIHKEVCEKAYDPDRNTFTQYYGSTELDAATLLIPTMGFLPPDDHRVIGTINAIERELTTPEGFVLRYSTSEHNAVDGLPGREGAFLACSFWLAEAKARMGLRKEACDLFRRLLDLRNDVGLLSEEYDPVQGRLVGNFPQAFSHVPLIHTAQALG
ncbi:glycoside hydrolase family 15 protein [Herbidospora sp. NBRC 101105]|uniref:glycoside hydrolase family 15 protein n=1 Tax=Herbidospora sp. NBRC 101105 TaxID=3032195 RepID=UPI0024A1E6A5|nr:glycoside hydrolase family 15 protein [Herbidospora sp. NBRC 101105]GLX96907.1 glucoamylase [Herbidospora sp. NBRC 101105]